MFWPFAWGLTMAAHKTNLPFDKYLTYLAQFAIYAVLLRGAACTVNDIMDVKYDSAVERTRGRPLPSGRISIRAAVIFLFVQYIISTSFLLVTLPALGLVTHLNQLQHTGITDARFDSTLTSFAIYPLLKRVTYWPQAWLGIAMNLGFPVAWTTVTGTLDVWIVGLALLGCWWYELYCKLYNGVAKLSPTSWTMLYGKNALAQNPSRLKMIYTSLSIQIPFMRVKIFEMMSKQEFVPRLSFSVHGSDNF
ncbi:hypothetical protein CVT24_011258 [Panaeolus cyanescens]|uniref:4-hydroxybenzoate polyprenyltransferase, mitochondrial n=1 Tax=Panaeolus cyanescens TaxID=181874 RepID=A0A409VI73_9AGAR|nr:hypothetical protein CVT24_011258 [Panaeolus cyanescens]